MFKKLKKHKVKHELYIFEKSGHGGIDVWGSIIEKAHEWFSKH
jgi:dipeptidyl aminopeptidase/acylaminoacyl peptidase